ncbi:hypothetical protein [uncultured Paenibacillus sp.]|uniref:hypothetical protein n=1 Tax=uncultured Paenibacillus sp. TaxID=227322 RepID=UPI0015ADDAC6|nr:hypothetical protein [uncultured Paenibacillus sp.]
MKKILLSLIGCLMISISLSACWNDDTNEQKTQAEASNEKAIDTVSVPNYDDFTKFLEDFQSNIVIDGFSLIPPFKTIFLIEREYTFNKKDTITLGGGKNDFNPTQQLFIFENKDKSIQIYVRFAYTEVDMGNNLVSWEFPSGDDGADIELSNRNDMATYTYKNLIVTVTQNAKTKADNRTTKNAVKSVLHILDTYYSK